MSDSPQGAGWWQASDGRWYPPQPYPPPQQGQPGPIGGPAGYGPGWAAPAMSGLAIASLVLAVLWLGGLGSVLAIVFAVIALSQIRRSEGRQRGSGLATAGLVIGIIGILGAVLFYSLIAVFGSRINAIVNDLNPRTLSLGQAGTYSAQANDGVVSVTVYSVDYPVTSSNPFVSPPPGDEFAVASVKECAGADGLPNGTNTLGWQLVLPDNTTVAPTLDARSPGLGSFRAVAANACVTGYITFQIAAGSHPSYIEYDGAIFTPYRWAL